MQLPTWLQRLPCEPKPPHFWPLSLSASAPLYLRTLWCYTNAVIIIIIIIIPKRLACWTSPGLGSCRLDVCRRCRIEQQVPWQLVSLLNRRLLLARYSTHDSGRCSARGMLTNKTMKTAGVDLYSSTTRVWEHIDHILGVGQWCSHCCDKLLLPGKKVADNH